jgi:hypothetical protein
MSRTARALIAGLVTAGVLVVGAGAAYADDLDSDTSGAGDQSSSSQDIDGDSSDSPDSSVSEPADADPMTGVLGSLPVGL